MREIKFRAWDNEGMRMVTENELGEYLWVFQNGGIKILAECETAREQGGETVFINDWQPIDAHIMQFTGLHDKNGAGDVCLFEGDILSLDGKIIGNIYEYEIKAHESESYIVVPKITSKAWIRSVQKIMDSGFGYTE